MVSFCSSSVGTPSISVPVCLFSPLATVQLVSLLQFSQFKAEFHDYLDQTVAAYILSGILEGFHIGFEALSVSLRSASSNMHLALDHPSIIDAYLDKEVSCSTVAGNFSNPRLFRICTSVVLGHSKK